MPNHAEQHCAVSPTNFEDQFAESLVKVSPWLACSMIVRVHDERRLETGSALALLKMHQERLARQMLYLEEIIRCRDDEVDAK